MGETYEVSELGDMLIYQNEKGDTKVDVYFFLNMTGGEVLSGAGHATADQAKRHALKQYEIYDEHRLLMQEEQVVDELLQDVEDIKMGKK